MPPQRLSDVFDSPHRHSCEIHFMKAGKSSLLIPHRLHRLKNTVIGEVASALRKVFTPPHVTPRTFVPMPSSKASDHPDYCDRLLRSLTTAFAGYDDLLAITKIDRSQLHIPLRQEVVLFDDVLTSVARCIHANPFELFAD